MKRLMGIILAIALAISGAGAALAHSGRTDKNGGHKDNKNASGLGSYHYHCGGYPAHLHSGGVCPYKSGGATPKPTAKPASKPATKPAATAAPAPTRDTAALAQQILTIEGEDYLYGVTNNPGVNIRAGASMKAEKIGSLANTGTLVTIAETLTPDGNQAWYMIVLGEDAYGFVHGNFIDLIDVP